MKRKVEEEEEEEEEENEAALQKKPDGYVPTHPPTHTERAYSSSFEPPALPLIFLAHPPTRLLFLLSF